jgi:glutathione reductase (NADPH)
VEKQFDLIVIGTGAAGSPVAHACRQAEWNVAIVDSRPFGGTCALRGCDPKKVLVGAADVIDWTRRMQGKGIAADARMDWSGLMRFKRTFTDPVPENREEGFEKTGITTFHERAHFIDRAKLQVGEDVLTARFFHIAAGARAATLGIDGEQHLRTSDQFLELDELPERIAFVGGGYISFEFAHVAARAGAEALIIHRGKRALEGFDPDLVDKLVEASRDVGIEVRLNRTVKSIAEVNSHFTIKASIDGNEESFETDLVVHGAGRVPDIEDLDLHAANIKREKKGVSVNKYLQSVSNPQVYAAGDAAASGGLPLTPVASMQAQIVADNILEGNQRQANYQGLPTVVFTIPPLASVGLQEEAARAQGLKFRTNYEDTSKWYSSRRINLRHTAFKVLIEEKSERILGAHLLGAHAEETINLFGLAVRTGLTAKDLRDMIYGYPTHASDIAHMLS